MVALGFSLGPLFGLLYRMDRTTDARATAEALRRAAFGPSHGRIQILNTVVPTTVAYRQAASARLPVHRFEPSRRGPSPSGLETMTDLLRELPLGIEEADLEELGGHTGKVRAERAG